MSYRAALLLAVSFGCAPPPSPELVVYTSAPLAEALEAFCAELPVAVEVRVEASPRAHLGERPDALEVAVEPRADCSECFVVEPGPVVVGGSVRGAQYGLAHLLEASGARFYHPEASRWPASLAWPAEGAAVYGVEQRPEMSLRGLHLHTLHPTEAYWAFLEPGEAHLAEARRIVDWVVKNRGNLVQLYLLEGFETDPERVAHLRAIVDYAHLRGVRVGVAAQLFSGANLQRGYDLTSGGADAEAEIARSLAPLDPLGIDTLRLSFGEFSGEDPARFVAVVDAAVAEAHRRWPDIEVTASVHVGDDLRVDYEGESDLLYYFLVKFADPRLTPWIHTVMYYTLFDPASGAYRHEDFSEHREYLFERLADDAPVAYYPESAYWVAFDNSVPTYLPVYWRSRWRDQRLIRDEAEARGLRPLDAHVTFSSGWEWGYWQTDYLTLRSNFTLPARFEDGLHEMLAPLGEDGARAANAIAAVADAQHDALILGRLGPYLAGRDAVMDAGYAMDVVAAPDRVAPSELARRDPVARLRFEREVVEPLVRLAVSTENARASLTGVTDPWIAEIDDGLAVDVHRARFVAAIYRAALATTPGEADEALAVAEAELGRAREVIGRRHEHLWDADPSRLTARRRRNSTLYQYGYLREAALLCYWTRELALARNGLRGAEDRVPACVL